MKNKLIDCYFVKIEHAAKKRCQKFYYEALTWLLIIYQSKCFLQSVSRYKLTIFLEINAYFCSAEKTPIFIIIAEATS